FRSISLRVNRIKRCRLSGNEASPFRPRLLVGQAPHRHAEVSQLPIDVGIARPLANDKPSRTFRAKMLRQRGVVAYAAESLRRTIPRGLAPQRLAEGLDLTAGSCDEFHERQATLLRDRIAPREHDGAVHDVAGAELYHDRHTLLNPAPALGR